MKKIYLLFTAYIKHTSLCLPQSLLLVQVDPQPIIVALLLSRYNVQTNGQLIFYYHTGFEILNFKPFAHLALQVYDQPCRRVLHYG